KNRYALMASDTTALYDRESFTSCTLLVMCYVDALASPGLDSDRGRFSAFVEANFPELCQGLRGRVVGKSAGELLYDRFRNGLVQGRGPKSGFALCRDDELSHAYVGEVLVEGTVFVGINVDRLVKDFVALVKQRTA